MYTSVVSLIDSAYRAISLIVLIIITDSLIICFFFFKQKTAYEMRISDWSSDVCSSDLPHLLSAPLANQRPQGAQANVPASARVLLHRSPGRAVVGPLGAQRLQRRPVRRAHCISGNVVQRLPQLPDRHAHLVVSPCPPHFPPPCQFLLSGPHPRPAL